MLVEVEHALEETRRKVQSLEANLHEKKGSEEQTTETEKKLAELKKAHVDLAKDMDSRLKAASQISEKSFDRRQRFGTQPANSFKCGEREQKFAIMTVPCFRCLTNLTRKLRLSNAIALFRDRSKNLKAAIIASFISQH